MLTNQIEPEDITWEAIEQLQKTCRNVKVSRIIRYVTSFVPLELFKMPKAVMNQAM
jgi:hypothetical protein